MKPGRGRILIAVLTRLVEHQAWIEQISPRHLDTLCDFVFYSLLDNQDSRVRSLARPFVDIFRDLAEGNDVELHQLIQWSHGEFDITEGE